MCESETEQSSFSSCTCFKVPATDVPTSISSEHSPTGGVAGYTPEPIAVVSKSRSLILANGAAIQPPEIPQVEQIPRGPGIQLFSPSCSLEGGNDNLPCVADRNHRLTQPSHPAQSISHVSAHKPQRCPSTPNEHILCFPWTSLTLLASFQLVQRLSTCDQRDTASP